jgi:beta-glucosidase
VEHVAHPDTGEPGVQFTLLGADGSILDDRVSPRATTLVGFDDGLAGRVTAIRLRARLRIGGAVEIGGMGAGHWHFQIGAESYDYDLAVSGSGFGEEVLAPPARTFALELHQAELVEAMVTLKPADKASVGGLFGLVVRPAARNQSQVIAQAAQAAASADVAVVVVGLTEEQETESVDKSTLRLPGLQDELVSAVAATARKTIVVVNAATPVIMPWLHQVDAVLWAGLPGQEGGDAVAAALLGDIEPAGRLVTSFPSEDGAAPAWSVTPDNGELRYSEGPFIGYRGYAAAKAPEPAFWFGHGLGYATWDYSNAELEASGVSVTVTNTGQRPSREVVQVYFQPSETDQPVRLVGWSAVSLAPGASQRVDVRTDKRMWRRWNTQTSTWDTLTSGGQLLIARGLGDVRATLNLAG